MSRKKREAAKAHYELIQQSRVARRETRRHAAVQKEEGIANALTKKGRPAPFLSWRAPSPQGVIERRAPKLLEDLTYARAVEQVEELKSSFIRPLDTWEPRGKGKNALFRSLCDHVFALFPVPPLLWNAFFDNNVRELKYMVLHVAGGGSLPAYCKTTRTWGMRVPLTRKMCHDLLTTPAEYGLTDAIRLVQVRAAGGGRRLFEAWRHTRFATALQDQTREAFWYTVIEWFARQPMLDMNVVGPLCDYISHRWAEDATFSMKGRGALPLLQGMREWHGALHVTRGDDKLPASFQPCGLQEALYDDYFRHEDGRKIDEAWFITEILTARELRDEGTRMGHCVWSYGNHIVSGHTSIWSVVMEDGKGPTGRWHMVTVEVSNNSKRIVQARGRFNRSITSRELQVLTRWANANGLTISLGAW